MNGTCCGSLAQQLGQGPSETGVLAVAAAAAAAGVGNEHLGGCTCLRALKMSVNRMPDAVDDASGRIDCARDEQQVISTTVAVAT